MKATTILGALTLALTLLASADAQAAAKRIGTFRTRAHELAGEVFALDDRTFEIRNMVYDGLGPAAFFWVGTGAVSSSGMRALVVPGCGMGKLPRYSGDTVKVELPPGKTINDIEYLSVWCEAADANFGEVVINADSRTGVAAARGTPACSTSGTFPVKQGWNCETLRVGYQVRWRILGSEMNVELVGNVKENYYMGFGVSGKPDSTAMVGSDVVIAAETGNGIQAVDYFMSARSQCANGSGVCPDTVSSNVPGTNDVTRVSGERKLDTLIVRYTRPVAASDSKDLAFKVGAGEKTFVSWATGPFNVDANIPQIHRGEMSFPSRDVSFEFGRTPVDNCATPITAMEVVEKEPVLGWTRPVMQNVTDITARIGPSGGEQGVTGITGDTSWGIAWWMSETGTTGKEVLIPAIAVERGLKYTFRVFGGDDESNGASHHPMYITSDKDGGLSTKSPEARTIETIYAGVNVSRQTNESIISFTGTAQGSLCEFTNKGGTNPNDFKTFEDYSKTVNKDCIGSVDETKAGVLEWTVPEDLEASVVYYQCLTHRDLGYKLVVFDKGQVDQARLLREAGGGKKLCKATFKGVEETFGGCATVEENVLEVFWNVNETSIDTLFSARSDGWAGVSWGNDAMVPANAAIAYKKSDGSVSIDDYSLTARASSGVQPAGNQRLTGTGAEFSDGNIVGRFTRPLSAPGIKTVEIGDIDLMWAIGPSSPSGTQLERHSTREVTRINLRSGEATTVVDPNRAFFLVHGILMTIAWILLAPAAILWMRFFKKMNPLTFQVHRALNSLAVLACLVAFIIGVVRGSHSNVRHLAIGVIVTAFALWQAVSGALRPHKGTPKRKAWFLGHAYPGRVAAILAIINVFFGIFLFKDIFSDSVKVWYIVVGVVVGLFVVIIIGLSLLPNKFPVTEKDVTHDDHLLSGVQE